MTLARTWRSCGTAAVLCAIGALLISGCGRPSSQEANSTASGSPGTTRLAGILGADDRDFERVYEPRRFEFPRDHGPHPDYRNEWWYVTGNLWSAAGERYGYELTLFRFSLTPHPVEGRSAWRTNQLFVGHFALSDASEQRMHVSERYARGSLGLAGATVEPMRIWLEDWELKAAGADSPHGVPWQLSASGGEAAIDLELDMVKPPVPNGRDGLSQKSAEPGNASYYYSATRLDTTGRVRLGDRSIAVDGSSWLDREWSSSALAADQQGWDWFALQFDDGSELLFYQIRRVDGSRDPMSAGTWVAADATTQYLAAGDVELTVLEYWDSPAGGRYPSAWRLGVPGRDLAVRITPIFSDQELDTAVRYWEGAVDVAGTRNGRAIDGHGYVELTGYADGSDADRGGP